MSEELQKLAEQLKPHTRVLLSGLTKHVELNGQSGIILPQMDSAHPEVQGCMKVRLDSGREVAVKAQNIQPMVVAPQALPIPPPPPILPPAAAEVQSAGVALGIQLA